MVWELIPRILATLARRVPPKTQKLLDELKAWCDAPPFSAEKTKNLTTRVMIEEMGKVFPGLPIEVETKICSNWGEK